MAFDFTDPFWEHDEFQTLNKTSTSKPRHIFQLETYTSYQSVFFDDFAWHANITVIYGTGKC